MNKKKLFYVALIPFNILVLFLIGEIVARIYLAQKAADELPPSHPAHCLNKDAPQNAPVFKPGCTLPGLGINSLGFRSREINLNNLHSRKIIMILGESVAFGWGAKSNETTFGYVLERRLGLDKYIILNAGVPGMAVSQMVEYYNDYCAQFHPDILIIFCGWNDLVNTTLHPEKVRARLHHQPYHPSLFRDPLNFFIEKSRLCYLLYRTLYFPVMVQANHLQNYHQAIIDNYESVLKKFLIKETEKGKAVFVLTLPTYLNENILDRMAFAEYNAEVASNMNIYSDPATLTRLQQIYNQGIRQNDTIPGVQVVDLDRYFSELPFEKRRSMFAGDITHLNDNGNRLIAEQLYDAMNGQ